jgi:Domain of unknown function (DUF1918)
VQSKDVPPGGWYSGRPSSTSGVLSVATKKTAARKPAKRRVVKKTAARTPTKRRVVKKTVARTGGSGAGGAGRVGIALIEIGDRIAVEAEKVGREPRAGVVTHVAGAMIGVRWNDGDMSSFIPARGSLRVVGHAGERVNKRP